MEMENFTIIDKILDLQINSIVNVRAIIKSVSGPIRRGRSVRNTIELVDKSNRSINLIMWNEHAYSINKEDVGKVFIIWDSLVREFNNHIEIHRIKESECYLFEKDDQTVNDFYLWWDVKKNDKFVNLSKLKNDNSQPRITYYFQ